jgi:hypothetical protein
MTHTLQSVVDWFKPRILLPDFVEEEHWQDGHSEAVLEWMGSVSAHLYFWIENSSLLCSKQIPHVCPAMQFSKRSTSDTSDLTSLIFYMTSQADPLARTIETLSDVYMPYAAYSGASWSENSRRDFLNQSRKFMACVVEIYNQAKGRLSLIFL